MRLKGVGSGYMRTSQLQVNILLALEYVGQDIGEAWMLLGLAMKEVSRCPSRCTTVGDALLRRDPRKRLIVHRVVGIVDPRPWLAKTDGR